MKTKNILYVAFLVIALLQSVLMTMRLVGIFANLNITPSGQWLFYLCGTVIFSCVVNVVLLLIFRSNTLLPHHTSMLVSRCLLIYQGIIIVALAAALLLMLL